MEKELNIAAILKDKPKGTKLWSPIFGECTFDEISCNNSCLGVDTNKRVPEIFYANGKYDENGECTIFPSKEMRDWRKFAWKKGDVLNMDGYRVVFDKWLNDNYTRFNAVHLITSIGGYIDKPLQNRYSPISNFITRNWRKMTDAETKIYMDSLERECGGKLNMETLQIEKAQPEFKDGDIITIMPHIGDKLIYLFKSEDDEKYYGHAFLDVKNIAIVNEDSYCHKDFCTARPSTEEEKQQLFDALAEEGKAWDTEKKQIVDLPKKCELNPFDRVLVRDNSKQKWIPDMYRFYDKDEEFPYNCFSSTYKRCIPYNEDTKHLLGTTDEWKGGEG